MLFLKRALLGVAAFATCSLLSATPSEAAFASGHISSTFYSDPANYAFRIILDTPPSGCNGNFLYINAADADFETYVAGLISAYYGGKTVGVTYTVDSGNFCHINEFAS